MTLPSTRSLAIAGASLAAVILITLVVLSNTLHQINIKANEAQALQDILDFAETENKFAMATGAYGLPEALNTPRFTWPVRNGYRFVLRPNAPGVELLEQSTFVTYRYIAYPVMEDAPGAPSYFYDNQHGTIHSRTDGFEATGDDEVVWPPSSVQPQQ